MVTKIKEQQVDVDRHYRWVWFGDNVVEDICKCRFTYRMMADMAKTEWGILIMVFILVPHKKFERWRRMS